jgi:hypothetical protein
MKYYFSPPASFLIRWSSNCYFNFLSLKFELRYLSLAALMLVHASYCHTVDRIRLRRRRCSLAIDIVSQSIQFIKLLFQFFYVLLDPVE